MSNVEVIDIDTSTDEEESRDKDVKPQLSSNNGNPTIENGHSSPDKILESRRKTIEDALNQYEECRDRLTSLEQHMNDGQKEKWAELTLQAGMRASCIKFTLSSPFQPSPSRRFDSRTAYTASPPRSYDRDEDDTFGLSRFDNSMVPSYGGYARRRSAPARPKKAYRRKTTQSRRTTKSRKTTSSRTSTSYWAKTSAALRPPSGSSNQRPSTSASSTSYQPRPSTSGVKKSNSAPSAATKSSSSTTTKVKVKSEPGTKVKVKSEPGIKVKREY